MTGIDYDAWAKQYDRTRGASPSVLRPLLDALGPAEGRTLLDIGGGTGNYSVALRNAGFAVIHCDPSAGMVRAAAAKTIPAVIADGQRLPFRQQTLDCAVAIKVMNHVPDRAAFFEEARRVVRSGPLVLVHAMRETLRANWITHYIPTILEQDRFRPESETVDELRAASFRDVTVDHIFYEDMEDGSAQALKRFPESFLDRWRIMNTSLLSREPPNVLDDALAAIRRDIESGQIEAIIAGYRTLEREYGDGSVFTAWP
jgi:ubiquinone/menaquinone biosynthesis C-methylase UbiE